jgi:hypothetical protein
MSHLGRNGKIKSDLIAEAKTPQQSRNIGDDESESRGHRKTI